MAEITVIGLGLTGAALARAITAAGHDIRVWNRASERLSPFERNGDRRCVAAVARASRLRDARLDARAF